MGDRAKKALIVGGGPVGALTALSLHNRGWEVEVWEGREDPRSASTNPQNLRSINLAISSRGITSLRSVDPKLAEDLLEEAIPMKGRMIHHLPVLSKGEKQDEGRREGQIYDPAGGECINSLPRPLLNLRLIDALPASIPLHFNTKLSHIDWRTKTAYAKATRTAKASNPDRETKVVGKEEGLEPVDARPAEDSAKPRECEFDLVIGCDGSWSKVRESMMRVERLDFSQSFIPHEYIELHMPPKPATERPDASGIPSSGHSEQDEGFQMEKNYLHIWPRKSFMLIGLPNKDGSFTLTLFAPRKQLNQIKTRADASAFFDDNFADAVRLVGKEQILDDFERNPRAGLVSIGVNPSHYIDKSGAHALLLGDASHSMVPFYGQGLNCGLEDVRVLNCLLEKHQVGSTVVQGEDVALRKALEDYTEVRGGDLDAIRELAMENYSEMRDKVLDPLYLLRRALDSVLSKLLPPTPKSPILLPLATSTSSGTSSPSSSSHRIRAEPFPTTVVEGWSSLYSMVTFRPDVSYKEALRKEKAQREVLRNLSWGVGGITGMGILGAIAWASVAVRRAYDRS